MRRVVPSRRSSIRRQQRHYAAASNHQVASRSVKSRHFLPRQGVHHNQASSRRQRADSMTLIIVSRGRGTRHDRA